MIQTTELTNIDKIILGYKTEELLKKNVDVFTILDTLKINYDDLENPNNIIVLDILYKQFFGRQVIWEEEIFINTVVDLLVSRKYIGLFSDYSEALNDIKMSIVFNEKWWNEFTLKTNFNYNSL